jgi:hypothetical protein
MQPIIHIYPNASFHEEAYIVGNKAGLIKLHKALLKALFYNSEGCCEVSTTDGEGYNLHVIVTERDDIALPYTEDHAMETREKAVWPWELVREG